MKNIYLVGINHRTAPIDIREKFFLTPTEQDLLLSELKNNPSIIEAFVLSTCNRIEVYANVLEGYLPLEDIIRVMTRIKKLQYPSPYTKHFYTYQKRKAVEHLMRVTCGLDSLILGEKQILGQVKAAVERAREQSMFSKRFNILANLALRAGKKTQTETKISSGGSSVSWAAIVKVEEVVGTLEDKSILLIGAGKMSELAVGQIHNKNFRKLYLMNRTEANAKDLAKKYSGEVVGLCDIKEILSVIDICICSSGAPHYILEKSTIERVLDARNGRRLLFIDISMPRNIDPTIAELEGVELFAIDDLNEVVDFNMKIRRKAIHEVEAIISSKLDEYDAKINPAKNILNSSLPTT